MEKEFGRFARTGRSEILGIESRQWRKPTQARRGWGGYFSRRRKLVYLLGLIGIVGVWVFLFWSLIRG